MLKNCLNCTQIGILGSLRPQIKNLTKKVKNKIKKGGFNIVDIHAKKWIKWWKMV